MTLAMRLAEVAEALDGERIGADASVRGCSTDSRTVAAGELFFALAGPSFDGHDYLADAAARGAAAAVVGRGRAAGLPSVEVGDPRESLGRLAAAWRSRFVPTVVAATGSNGKTTVKEMVAAILRAAAAAGGEEVLASAGNLNNDIGLPLTLFRLGPEHHAMVVELGANHPGEIASLAAIARPEIGVVTQCAPAHIEGFGSIEGVAAAKGELFEALPAGGAAVINADDAFSGLWRTLASHCRQLTFGLSAPADVTARYRLETAGALLTMTTPVGECELRLALPGRHNVMNALAAAAVGIALDVPLATVARGLGAVETVKGRLQRRELPGGVTLIDDSYNANPASLDAALAVLEQAPGRRWLVLGDMAELGAEASDRHREAGRAARRAGVERLYAAGDLSADALRAFGGCGAHFVDPMELARVLAGALEPGVTVLVKGSRSMAMERVVSALITTRTPGGQEGRGCC